MPYTLLAITEQSGNYLTNYPVEIILDSSWNGWNANPTKDSIYITDYNGNPLYYWIEVFDTTNKKLVIHTKIPSLPANSTIKIKLYYAETNPYPSYNNGNQVFDFFDEFRVETSLDPNKWTTYETANSITFTSDGINITKTSGFAGICTLNTIDFSTLKKIIITKKVNAGDKWNTALYIIPTLPSSGDPYNQNDWFADFQGTFGDAIRLDKKINGTEGEVKRVQPIDPTIFHRHKLKLKITSSGIVIWDLDYSNVYRNTSETLFSTSTNYIILGVSADTGYTRTITAQYIAIGQAVDPEPQVTIATEITSPSINDIATSLLSSPTINDIVTSMLSSPTINDVVTSILSSPAINDIITSVLSSPSIQLLSIELIVNMFLLILIPIIIILLIEMIFSAIKELLD